ncbi:hypothetical protein HDV02_006234 [Globomyces sp. JEL0801]|nr:hypothetical protein HDV02_006234 [Globomyces sp. JEL0801]
MGLYDVRGIYIDINVKKRIHDDFNNGSDHYSDYLLNAINTTWRSEIQDWLTCPQKPQSVLLFQDTLLSVPALPKPTTECENVINGACISKHIKSLICRDPLCHDINLTGLDSLVCPEVWAKYSNLANCMNVWKGYQKKGEVGLPYYTKNILVEEKMLAQAAVRMAAIIEGNQ